MNHSHSFNIIVNLTQFKDINENTIFNENNNKFDSSLVKNLVSNFKDSTNNFILDNDIVISSKDTSEFYDPGTMYRYLIYREANYVQKENQMDMVDTYKQVKTTILVLNPLLN